MFSNDKKQMKLEKLYTKATGLTREANETFEQFEARVKAKDVEVKNTSQQKLNAAEAMYQYCIDNNYGQGLSRKWGIKHFMLIEQSLQSDEETLMCFIGLHNYISTTKHNNNFAYAITNKRIIMAQQKMMGQTVQTVLLDNLNDITLSTGPIFGVLTIDTIKEKFNVGVNSPTAQSINNKVHEILLSLQKTKNAPVQMQSSSSADEILKYKNLLDMGAITQEEFEQKKSELLGI